MRKLILLLSVLPLWTLLPLWGQGGRLFAAVQVQNISTDYANKRVTFNLSWAAGTRNATHLSKVWVLVDYVEVNALNAPTGAWQRATVVSATATNGTVSGNTGRGFFLQGTDGTFSSTVTVTLSGVPAKFNWCAYATDYPPQMIVNSATDITLKGTVPFIVKYTDNTTDKVNAKTYSIQVGKTLASITDATAATGTIQCLTRNKMAVNGYCCTGQTLINGYCRDLAADGAIYIAGCGEVKNGHSAWPNGEVCSYPSNACAQAILNASRGCYCNMVCTSGWPWSGRVPTYYVAIANDWMLVKNLNTGAFASFNGSAQGCGCAPVQNCPGSYTLPCVR